ncbi:MAG: hypothetical protein HQ553_17065 [Chloroflexi bacterium]|nr:hypothetical protein [Chloroflexota bacterium]
MGTKLEEYFDKVKEKGGLSAQIKLAMITKMARKSAATQPDSAENIAIFEDAMKQIEAEF